MSKKKKKWTSRPWTPPRFKVGTPVYVKPGIKDADFPDMPVGGWAGTIAEVDAQSSPALYLVLWNQRTLDNMHPVYRKRCARDDLDYTSMWLGEKDIVLDDGAPPVIEQPGEIAPLALSAEDEDDPVRIALGLTADDRLPEVGSETLTRYHRYLQEHLTLPFPARYTEETGPFEETTFRITVVGLLGPEDCDEMYGLICESREDDEEIDVPLGEVKPARGNPNRQLIEDYSYWFWNYR
jgi:hypothetical protein